MGLKRPYFQYQKLNKSLDELVDIRLAEMTRRLAKKFLQALHMRVLLLPWENSNQAMSLVLMDVTCRMSSKL